MLHRVRGVTGFVPIPDHPRSEKEYRELGSQLLTNPRMMVAEIGLQECWLYYWLAKNQELENVLWSKADNPAKNSLAFHIVQAQKSEWLKWAACLDPFARVFVWIDYAIFHIPGVTMEIIDRFLDQVENEPAIAIPGCWGSDYKYDDDWPCWRFCGGVMVVPRDYVDVFDAHMKTEYIAWIRKTGNVSWEVNTLARLERSDPTFPVWWYKADTHDASMFTNYQAMESADGKTALRGIESRYC
jgi:hypothetical protein